MGNIQKNMPCLLLKKGNNALAFNHWKICTYSTASHMDQLPMAATLAAVWKGTNEEMKQPERKYNTKNKNIKT